MIPNLCDLFPLGHKRCKEQVKKLVQASLDDSRKIDALNIQIVGFVGQIQELKGINNYQCSVLEKKIEELEFELSALKNGKEANASNS